MKGDNATQPRSVVRCNNCQLWTETADKAKDPAGRIATVGVCNRDKTKTTEFNGCAEGVPKK